MRLVRTEDSLRDATGNPQAKEVTRVSDGVQRATVLLASERPILKALQPILDDREQVVVKDAGSRTLDTAGAVLEVDVKYVLRASVLDAVGVAGVASLRVALIERSDVRGGVVG